MNDLALDLLRLFPWFFAGLAIVDALAGKWTPPASSLGATVLSALVYFVVRQGTDR